MPSGMWLFFKNCILYTGHDRCIFRRTVVTSFQELMGTTTVDKELISSGVLPRRIFLIIISAARMLGVPIVFFKNQEFQKTLLIFLELCLVTVQN